MKCCLIAAGILIGLVAVSTAAFVGAVVGVWSLLPPAVANQLLPAFLR